MNIAFNTAVSGMLSAQSQMATAARDTVSASARGEGIIQAAVAVSKAETAHAASAMVARTAAELTDTLLDITV
ncbi:flagellar hook protein FlgE [Maricaulis sp. CAU 1757]